MLELQDYCVSKMRLKSLLPENYPTWNIGHGGDGLHLTIRLRSKDSAQLITRGFQDLKPYGYKQSSSIKIYI